MTRASIFFARSFLRSGWIAGSSPAMTTAMICSLVIGQSERLRWIEIGAWNLDAHVDEVAEKARPHAGRLEMTDHGAVGGGAGAHVFEDLLHLDDVALEPGDLGDAG